MLQALEPKSHIKGYPSMWDKGERPSGKGRILVMDKEAIGLLHAISTGGYYKGAPANSHCIVVEDLLSDEVFVFFDDVSMRTEPEWLEDWEGEQDGFLADGVSMLMECEAIISHNFSGYDALALEINFGGLWNFNYCESRGKGRLRRDLCPFKVMDTLVMSRLLNPDRKLPQQAYAMGMGNVKPHSIEAHGIRVGRYKPENEDWTHLTDHMVHRCIEDVAIGKDYFLWLINNEWSEQISLGRNKATGKNIVTAYQMELRESFNMARQEYRGWRLDMPKAYARHIELNNLIEQKIKDFRPHMPVRVKSVPFKPEHRQKMLAGLKNKSQAFYADTREPEEAYASVAKAMKECHPERKGDRSTQWVLTKKSGEYTSKLQKIFPEMRGYEQDLPESERLVIGAFSPIIFEDIPLGNREVVKELLYPYGWRGVEFNDTDSAYIDEHGELPKPWSGKLNEKSMAAWCIRECEARGIDLGEDEKARAKKAESTAYSNNFIPEWCQGIAEWYIYCSRNGQILNAGDVANFDAAVDAMGREGAEFPKQQNGKRQIRGLIARAWNFELHMEAQDYYRLTGVWPTDGKSDPIAHDDDWRVPAVAMSIATNTFRMRHRNVVNIPSRGLYPLRDLFIASIGKMVLGCDGSGLELRMLAHFMNDLEYIYVVLNGDIHTHNQQKAGLPIRDMAKTFIYAFLYGSGIPNLAKVCGISEKEMKKVIDNFKHELPALAKLIDKVQEVASKRGYLKAIDSRWGRIRKQNGEYILHTALNVLLQMTGSLCMKYAQVRAEGIMIKEKVALDSMGYPAFLGNIHDEVQMEVPESEVKTCTYNISKDEWKAEEKREHSDDVGVWSAPEVIGEDGDSLIIQRKYHRAGEILAGAMKWAGEFFSMRIPLAGEYKIGQSWGDTH